MRRAWCRQEDALAARTFKELYERFPTGTRSERAAWKYGWWSYRNGDYPETVRVFESAALAFPRSDYRPSFLYWSARAYGRIGRLEGVDNLDPTPGEAPVNTPRLHAPTPGYEHNLWNGA